MQELSENIEKQRPALFKLASDSDEKDASGAIGGCGYVEVGVVMWRWVWLCGGGCDYVEVGVVMWRWVWLCGGGCGYVEMGVVMWRWVCGIEVN